MKSDDLEQIEIDLLLEAIWRRYGHDFRGYARASVERRIRRFMTTRSERNIAELLPRLLHDETFFAEMLPNFSVPVSEMFRDPFVYRALRDKVVPLLKTYPFVKIWHAGCANGEEVYSLAILLKEEGLLERTSIFATDFNEQALAAARQGIYPTERMQEFTRNYQEAGGKGSLSEYYRARHDAVILDAALKERITFANHNLAGDAVFGEMHLILCRNVLIYFNRALQDRALGLFAESLVRGGFLCLGSKESLRFSAVAAAFETIDPAARIFRKRATP